ncbi:MAG: hypothetical protein JWQ14_20 [Adhaeribacter sp.]|nr:hypothetical protein [Adhaeribacter sp.]
MLYKIFGFTCLIILSSCARQNYYQEDSLYQGGKPAALNPPEPGYVWATAGKQYQRSTLHTMIWGKHYREVWAAPVQAAVLNLAEVKGGLVPSEMGGGLQTTSLVLLDPAGRSFTLRTLDKDPSQSLSPFLQKTFISNLMRDQTSAINPYGAFTIPPMADATHIFHTNPQLYYVPTNAPFLGNYQKAFSGKLVMLEEKYDNKRALTPAFGAATNVINTKELNNRIKNSAWHKVDQLAFARARLFDLLISDFDRHEGQWNWAEYLTKQGVAVYKPIPKDRDYAFYQYADGVIPWLLTRRILVGHIKPFIHNIPDVGGIIYKGRELDEQFLNELTAEEWNRLALSMQAELTPAVIGEAITRLPESLYHLTGAKIQAKLNKRVAQLPQLAAEYYQLLAREVKIEGSDNREKFLVQQHSNKITSVAVFTLPANSQEEPIRLYYREFIYPATKKITLKGSGGKDEFVVPKSTRKYTEIIIKAGNDKDLIKTEQQVKAK